MSSKLGISNYTGSQYFIKDSVTVVDLNEWSKIVAYYEKLAPDTLKPANKPAPLKNSWSIFSLKKPTIDSAIAFTTMTAADPSNHTIYTSDLLQHKLLSWDSKLKPKQVSNLQSTAVAADFIQDKNTTLATFASIGVIDDANAYLGKLESFAGKDNATDLNQVIIASGLPRPVNIVHADFNHDGLTDYAVSCNGGDSAGGLFLLTQNANHQYNQSKIKEAPGAVQAITGDFNHDGWPDLMALFGKNDEGIWLFINNKKGAFTSRNLLRFPPVYGSSSFQLADFNKDGNPDVLYTCGNNYGNSRILKPYHGVYIFLNQGNFKLKQSYFYPINGCTKAIAADFNLDGKLDIATTAFFADFKNNPSEGCIYFEQNAALDFTPNAIPISSEGRWKTMDTIRNNGKLDLVLGNYARGFKIQNVPTFWNTHVPFIILKNNAILKNSSN